MPASFRAVIDVIVSRWVRYMLHMVTMNFNVSIAAEAATYDLMLKQYGEENRWKINILFVYLFWNV